MSIQEHSRLTFATLDRQKGFPEPPPVTGDEYPLPAWYRVVREKFLEDLDVEDLCRACRQQIHLEHVVPIALHRLQSDPLAGEMFDGELLVSLKSVPSGFWPNHAAEALTLKAVCERVRQDATITEDLRSDVEDLLSRSGHPQK